MVQFLTLDQINLTSKRVLVRVDLNVPVVEGEISDSSRISRITPTINEIIDRKGIPILISHFGRPKGKVNPAMTLYPLTAEIKNVMRNDNVYFAKDCIGPIAEEVVKNLKDGEIGLLENLRYHKGEEKNDPIFAAALAKLADIYVNDAFSASHRAHASTNKIASLLPCAAGRLMQSELEALETALEKPQRPVVAIVGGSKVSTKISVLTNLIAKMDVIVIGGGMANTFLYSMGYDMGKSLLEKDLTNVALDIIDQAKSQGCKLILPTDVIVSEEFRSEAKHKAVDVIDIPQNAMALDLGPKTIASIKQIFKDAKTVVWNGPLGAFEIKPFDIATVAIAQFVADLSEQGKLISVAGGGDTISALNKAGVEKYFSYISTAGGAFLEWLEGKPLPGVEALKNHQ